MFYGYEMDNGVFKAKGGLGASDTQQPTGKREGAQTEHDISPRVYWQSHKYFAAMIVKISAPGGHGASLTSSKCRCRGVGNKERRLEEMGTRKVDSPTAQWMDAGRRIAHVAVPLISNIMSVPRCYYHYHQSSLASMTIPSLTVKTSNVLA